MQWPPPLIKLIEILGQNNVKLVGGAVRTRLFGTYDPEKDHDLATIYTPNEVTKLLEAAAIKVIPTGLTHGTLTAVVDDHAYEITTLRKDIETDGRHAKVTFTKSWEEDSARRDFTINAMYLDLDGTLYDYQNGQHDFQTKTLKFVGDPLERYQEDTLRLLRYLRFVADLGWLNTIEETLATLQPHFPLQENLAPERVWMELKKLLTAQNLTQIFPYLEEYQPFIPLNLHFSKHNDYQTLITYPLTPAQHLHLLFPDAHLPLSRAEQTELKHLKTALSHIKNPPIFSYYLSGETEPLFPLTGQDVLNLGLPPGPQVGNLLTSVKTWWLGHGFPNKGACLTHLKTQIKTPQE